MGIVWATEILFMLIIAAGVFETADTLMKEFCENEKKRSSLPWSRPNRLVYPIDHLRIFIPIKLIESPIRSRTNV